MSLAKFFLKEAERKKSQHKEYAHSTVHSFEFQQLMDAFCDAEVGDEFAWGVEAHQYIWQYRVA